MEIVIDIPEKVYTYIQREWEEYDFDSVVNHALNGIKNGIPLPKGHGNLIDYDDLIAKLDRYGRKNVAYQLPYSPTIIFADKEGNC